jgi:hypothetical protein
MERLLFVCIIAIKSADMTRPPELFPTAQGVPPEVVHSPITETESMEKLRPNALWLKGRKSSHQLQINWEN